MNSKKTKGRTATIIIVALIASIVLYIAGLYTGLSFSNLVKQNTEQEIDFLVSYVESLDTNLQSIQLQEKFIAGLDEENSCKFADTYFSRFDNNLKYYWNLLPSSLEKYEKENEPTEEYLKLKQEYTSLSIRTWISSKDFYKKCKTDTIPILYFYSSNCEDCVIQGEKLDSLKNTLADYNKTLVVFTIDINQPEPVIELIKEYYSINSTPSLIVNEKTLQGKIFNENEILVNLDTPLDKK